MMDCIEEENLSELYQAIDWGIHAYQQYRDGKPITVTGRKFGNPLYQIEQYVDAVVSSDGPGFKWVRNRLGKMELKELEMGKHYPFIRSFWNSFSEDFRYSERVQLFFDCCKALNFEDEYSNFGMGPRAPSMQTGKTVSDIYNELLEEMRLGAKKPEFKKRLRTREYNAMRNYRSCHKYDDALFARYSRMLVLRGDFGYEQEFAEDLTAEDAVRDFERFLNNKRGKPSLFRELVGYMVKLEWGPEKKFHFHTILYFNGAKVKNDHHLGNCIGLYWRELVGGHGTFYNCNANKSKYRHLGIGMVSHDDQEMRSNLLLAIRYLTKSDQYLHAKQIGKNIRTFRRGAMPALRTSRAGRPRRSRENEQQ